MRSGMPETKPETKRDEEVGWVWEEADILSDYRAAFGEDPPRYARVAIMSDSDNTGERATAHFDSLGLSARQP